MQQPISTRRGIRGMTVIELAVMALVVVVLATSAFLAYRPTRLNTGYQAEGLRNDLRHMQFLASNWSMPLRLTRTSGSYSVVCPSITTPPCAASAGSPITNPGTGQVYTVTLESGVTFSATSSFDLDALGRPASGCTATCTALLTTNSSFTLTGDGASWTLTVAPITGFTTLATP